MATNSSTGPSRSTGSGFQAAGEGNNVCDGAPIVSASGGRQSAKMMEAQAYFQKVVKHELQVLLATGLEREVAVKLLLHRIVHVTDEPADVDVRRVMKQFQMNYDDAVRALIVKQEIGRLKSQGLDAFAAIEELTRKMQHGGVATNSTDAIGTQDNDMHGDEEDVGMASEELQKEEEEAAKNAEELDKDNTREDETDEHSSGVVEKDNMEKDRGNAAVVKEKGASAVGSDHGRTTHSPSAEEEAGEVTAAGTEKEDEEEAKEDREEDNSNNLSSLSLCQRIDQVSISTVPSPSTPIIAASITSSSFESPSSSHRPPQYEIDGTRSHSSSTFTLFSSHSRKRRVTSNTSPLSNQAISPERSTMDGPISSVTSPRHSSSINSLHLSMPLNRPLSPTFRFPTSKKQRLWSEDHEPFFHNGPHKTAAISVLESPSKFSSEEREEGEEDEEEPVHTRSEVSNRTFIGKRRRRDALSSSSESSSPSSSSSSSSSSLFEAVHMDEPVVHVSKRYRKSSVRQPEA